MISVKRRPRYRSCQSHRDVRDVAVFQGKIAAVERDIPPTKLERLWMFRKLFSHAVADRYSLPMSVTEERHSPGSLLRPERTLSPWHPGGYGVAIWRDHYRRCRIRQAPKPSCKRRRKSSIAPRCAVLAFLNIVGNGMGGGLEQSLEEMDPKLCAAHDHEISGHYRGSKDCALLDERALGCGARAVGCGGSCY